MVSGKHCTIELEISTIQLEFIFMGIVNMQDYRNYRKETLKYHLSMIIDNLLVVHLKLI